MPLMRATFFFQTGTNYGWTETYYSTLTTHLGVLNRAKQLLALRVNLLGTGATCTYIRVSDDEIQRDAMVEAVPAGDGVTKIPSNGATDSPFAALLVRLEAGTAARRQLYLRGVPDSMIVTGGAFLPSALWLQAYNLWRQELWSNAWGLKQQILAVGNVISSVTQNATSGDLTINTVTPHGLLAGNIVNILGSRKSPGLRGRHVVFQFVDPDTFTIKSPYVFKGLGGPASTFKVTFNVVAFTNVAYERVVKKSTGGPFDRPRGRRRAI